MGSWGAIDDGEGDARAVGECEDLVGWIVVVSGLGPLGRGSEQYLELGFVVVIGILTIVVAGIVQDAFDLATDGSIGGIVTKRIFIGKNRLLALGPRRAGIFDFWLLGRSNCNARTLRRRITLIGADFRTRAIKRNSVTTLVF